MADGNQVGGQPGAQPGLLVEHALVGIARLPGQLDVAGDARLADQDEVARRHEAEQQDGDEHPEREALATLQLVNQAQAALLLHGSPLASK